MERVLVVVVWLTVALTVVAVALVSVYCWSLCCFCSGSLVLGMPGGWGRAVLVGRRRPIASPYLSIWLRVMS